MRLGSRFPLLVAGLASLSLAACVAPLKPSTGPAAREEIAARMRADVERFRVTSGWAGSPARPVGAEPIRGSSSG